MEKDTLLSTNRLFHYTWKHENLVNILKEGFQVKYSLEKLGLFEFDRDGLVDEVAFPMACFCDIPLALAGNHRKVYGDYAIGLSKAWAVENAICPVLYLTDEGELQYILKSIIKKVRRNNPVLRELLSRDKKTKYEVAEIEMINLFDEIIDISMFIKSFIGIYKKGDFYKKHYKFYDEREWRYKPSKYLGIQSFLYKEDYQEYEKCGKKPIRNIEFGIQDITEILLPKNEIESLKEEISRIEKYKDFDLSIIKAINN